MFVRPMCDLLDVTVDGRNIEQCLTLFTYYRLFHWLTSPPTFLIFGSTIPRGVTAVLTLCFANKVARLQMALVFSSVTCDNI